jgi:hypothetical protein
LLTPRIVAAPAIPAACGFTAEPAARKRVVAERVIEMAADLAWTWACGRHIPGVFATV